MVRFGWFWLNLARFGLLILARPGFVWVDISFVRFGGFGLDQVRFGFSN